MVNQSLLGLWWAKRNGKGFLLSNSVLVSLHYFTVSPHSPSSQYYPEKKDKLTKSGKLKKIIIAVELVVGAAHTKTVSVFYT